MLRFNNHATPKCSGADKIRKEQADGVRIKQHQESATPKNFDDLSSDIAFIQKKQEAALSNSACSKFHSIHLET